MKVAFIGLGTMGMHMAVNLRKANHDVYAYNRTRSKAEAFVNLRRHTRGEPPRSGRAGRLRALLHLDAGRRRGSLLRRCRRYPRIESGTGLCRPQHY